MPTKIVSRTEALKVTKQEKSSNSNDTTNNNLSHANFEINYAIFVT